MSGLKITETDGGLRLKPDASIAVIIVPFLALMLWKVLPDFIQMFPPQDKNDYAGIVMLGLWILLLVGVGFFGVAQRLSARVELNHKGVFYADCLRKREISWCELKDYGISYVERTKTGRKQYILYFSQEILPEKNRNKKKLKGVVVKLDVDEKDYASVLTKVLPYCQRYITVTPPFIAE